MKSIRFFHSKLYIISDFSCIAKIQLQLIKQQEEDVEVGLR